MATDIVQPVLEDARRLAEVHVATWQVAYAGLMPEEAIAARTVERRLQMWEHVLTNHPERALAARVDGVLVGFALFGPARPPGPEKLGELYALYVLPTHWGTGVGRALGVRAVAALAESYDTAVLWVAAENRRAIRFYEKGGWIADGAAERVEVCPGVELDERRYRRAETGSQQIAQR